MTWPVAFTLIWIAGVLSLLARAGLLRRRFVAAAASCRPAPDDWNEELRETSRAMRLRRVPELAVHAELGPCLSWRPFRYIVIVPRELWRSLPSEQRRLILRHELSHVRRGDLWTALAARAIAACHWFNPFAWLACRRLEECAEWACDEAACGEDEAAAAAYSRLLLELRLTGHAPACSAAMARPNTVATRVRRLLRESQDGPSLARSAVFAAILLAVMGIARVELRLTAQETNAESASAASSETGQREPSNGKLPVFSANAPVVPGKPRPEGLLSRIGDDRSALSWGFFDLMLTADGNRLFHVNSSQIIDVIDAATLTVEQCLRSEGARVLKVSPSPDGRRLAVASLDGSLRIWDVAAQPARILEELRPFGEDQKETWITLTTSLDRSRFCISDQTLVVVYEWTAGGLQTVFERRQELSWRPAALSPNGRRLAIREEQQEVSLWNLSGEGADEVGRLPLEDQLIGVIGWRNDEILILARETENASFVQQVLCTDSALEPLGGEMAGFHVATYLPRAVFFDGGLRGVMNVADAGPCVVDCSREDWVIEQRLTAPELLQSVVISPDGRTLYGVAGGVLRTWRRERGTFVPQFDVNDGAETRRAADVAFLADGRTLLAATGKVVRMFATDDPAKPRELGRLPTRGLATIQPHPFAQEALLVSSGDTGCVAAVACTEAGLVERARVEYEEHWRKAPWCANYAPDGKTVAVGFWDRSVKLYDNTPDGLKLLSDHAGIGNSHVCVLAYSPDGRRLASGDFRHQLKLFDVDGATLAGGTRLKPYGEAVRHAVFSPDGRMLIAGAQNGEIRIIDLAAAPPSERTLLYPGQPVPEESAHDLSVASLRLAAGGRLLLSLISWKGSARLSLWSFPQGDLLQTWESDFEKATITPNGRLIAVARGDGTICLLAPSGAVLMYLDSVSGEPD